MSDEHELVFLPIDRDLHKYIGKRVDGGCSDCAAWFDVRENHCTGHRVCAHIFHDASCPFFRGMTGGTAQAG